MYLALEDNPRRLKRRLEQILQGEPAPRRLRLEWEWPKLQDGGLDKIRQFLEQHPGTKAVVIDTLQKIRGGAKSNSNLYAEDYEASSYGYDPTGNLVSSIDSGGTTIYRYNSAMRPAQCFFPQVLALGFTYTGHRAHTRSREASHKQMRELSHR